MAVLITAFFWELCLLCVIVAHCHGFFLCASSGQEELLLSAVTEPPFTYIGGCEFRMTLHVVFVRRYKVSFTLHELLILTI